jgi:hypothetical protein
MFELEGKTEQKNAWTFVGQYVCTYMYLPYFLAAKCLRTRRTHIENVAELRIPGASFDLAF